MPKKAKPFDTETALKRGIGTVQHRLASIVRVNIDDEARSVELSFSSEEPVDRFFGQEILDHEPSSIRLGRLKDGGPVLLNHDSDRQIGVVESAEVVESKGRVLARFSRNGDGAAVFEDIQDGIRRNVSVGYRVHDMVLEKHTSEGPDIFRVTDWEPLEVSIVSVPADTSVGIGRADEENIEETNIMSDDIKKDDPAPDSKPEIDVRAIETEAAKKAQATERTRVKEINAIVEQFSTNKEIASAARSAIENGTGWQDFGKQALDLLGRAPKAELLSDDTPVTELGMERKEVERYSVLRALRAHLAFQETGTPMAKIAPFEHKVGLELMDRLPAERQESVRGILVPWDVQQSWTSGSRVAPMDTTENVHLVGTDHLAGSFIEALRARSVVMSAGARSLSGLVGDVSIPRLDTPATFAWLAEDGSVTAGEQVTGSVTLSPTTVAGAISVTRRLLKQSSPDVEMLIRDDLTTGAAIEIDNKALTGSGAANQPTGVVNQSGVGTSTILVAGSPTYVEFVEFETDVAAANGLRGSLAYVMHPTVVGNAKTTVVDAGSGRFVVEGRQDGGGLVGNGYPVLNTVNAGANGIIFGNWTELLIGFWGVLDLQADPFTDGAKGGLVIRAFQDIDVAVRHAASFSVNA